MSDWGLLVPKSGFSDLQIGGTQLLFVVTITFRGEGGPGGSGGLGNGHRLRLSKEGRSPLRDGAVVVVGLMDATDGVPRVLLERSFGGGEARWGGVSD
eukprot:5376702-Pyramimonas_sp.AAC.1